MGSGIWGWNPFRENAAPDQTDSESPQEWSDRIRRMAEMGSLLAECRGYFRSSLSDAITDRERVGLQHMIDLINQEIGE